MAQGHGDDVFEQCSTVLSHGDVGKGDTGGNTVTLSPGIQASDDTSDALNAVASWLDSGMLEAPKSLRRLRHLLVVEDLRGHGQHRGDDISLCHKEAKTILEMVNKIGKESVKLARESSTEFQALMAELSKRAARIHRTAASMQQQQTLPQRMHNLSRYPHQRPEDVPAKGGSIQHPASSAPSSPLSVQGDDSCVWSSIMEVSVLATARALDKAKVDPQKAGLTASWLASGIQEAARSCRSVDMLSELMMSQVRFDHL